MTSKWLRWVPPNEPTKPTEPPAFALQGHAVEFECGGERYYLVADDGDAKRLIEREGVSRGEIWTTAELDLIAAVRDQTARDEIAQWKRMFNGTLRSDSFNKPHFRKETKRR